jgi:hypothetical protein
MTWGNFFLLAIGVLLLWCCYWVWRTFFRDPDTPRELHRLTVGDAKSPSFGVWVWTVGRSVVADMTLPLPGLLPPKTVVRQRRSPLDESNAPPFQKRFEVKGSRGSWVARALDEEAKGALVAMAEATGEGVRLAGGALRAMFPLSSPNDERMWEALRSGGRVVAALEAQAGAQGEEAGRGDEMDDDDPLDPFASEEARAILQRQGRGLPRRWGAEAIRQALRAREVFEQAVSFATAGLERVAFSVRVARALDGVTVWLEAPLARGLPDGLEVRVRPEALKHAPRREDEAASRSSSAADKGEATPEPRPLTDREEIDEIFESVYEASGRKADLVDWWADGGARQALVRLWIHSGARVTLSSAGVTMEATVGEDDDEQVAFLAADMVDLCRRLARLEPVSEKHAS